ncbi:hypothetical protein HDU97_001279 [Phlyctochytrium planicorne]|nr:hypothetical protein HDU97_001279 [Phlyctochytrium planicorne]
MSSSDAVQAYRDKVGNVITKAMLASTMYIADKVGIFKILAQAGDHGLTIQEIAVAPKASGKVLSERYLTECLSSLAAAGIIEAKNSEAGIRATRFVLPFFAAPVVADENSTKFANGWIDMMQLLFGLADDVAACFIKNSESDPERGVPFDKFGDKFVNALNRSRGEEHVQEAVKDLEKIPGLIEKLQTPGSKIVDVGCGPGNVIRALARKYPQSKFYGYDCDETSIRIANERLAGDLEAQNIQFEVVPAEDLHGKQTDGFDLILTIDVIHDTPHPKVALEGIRKALKDDGLFIMIEPAASSHLHNNINEDSSFLYGISLHHCMTQSLANGGVGVGAAWGKEEAERVALESGFTIFENTHSPGTFKLMK